MGRRRQRCRAPTAIPPLGNCRLLRAACPAPLSINRPPRCPAPSVSPPLMNRLLTQPQHIR
jgi:hypothetical protein